jgi:alpha-glucuronidase
VVDGALQGQTLTGMAAVTNIGDERNWCGHPFAAANWYAFGRLSWDNELAAETLAEEWLRMTFGNDEEFLKDVIPMMLASREAVVDYMTPLGLHHIMARSHHYGPGPWIAEGRRDWTSVYYHRADEAGIGFDRTKAGSDAVSQYPPELARVFGDLRSCPENLLLWFHHVPWDHRMSTGNTLWDELCLCYQRGVDTVRHMQRIWARQQNRIDPGRFEHVRALFTVQEAEAVWWKDACLLYFQTFSKRPLPEAVEEPKESLDYYRALEHHYVPGI